MNVLFLSLGTFDDMGAGSVHIDIIKRFAKEQNVYLLCKRERREHKRTELSEEFGIQVLRVKTGNIKKAGLIEKGLSTLLVEPQFKRAVKEYFADIRFDLVIYTTPPITFANVVKFIKKRDGAVSYLMLKDIFPQNAVDIGIMSKRGWKGLIYHFFREKEKRLYRVSDYIGCMSPANMEYVTAHNSYINPNRVEECPNSAIVKNMDMDEGVRESIRKICYTIGQNGFCLWRKSGQTTGDFIPN